MTIKWRLIVFFIVTAIGLFACKPKYGLQKLAIMDIYNRPISTLLKDDKVAFFTENGEKKIAHIGGVEFIEGRDSLISYIKRVYYKNPNYYKYGEFNVLERFFVLFNKKLEIVEVRIMYRQYANNERFYYDSIFVNAIKSTSGMWYKTVKDKNYYTYLIQIKDF